MTDRTSTGREALARPELARLWQAARERLERNGRAVTSSPIRLGDLSDAEVAAICALLSRRRPRGNDMRVNLVEVDEALSSGPAGRGLLATLETISGPVVDRRARRAELADRRLALWTSALAHPASEHEPVRAWLESLRRRGRITRLAVGDPHAVLTSALDGLDWLLSHRDSLREEPLPLSALAAVQVGDGHALDPETPLGTLLTDALCELSGHPDARAAWANFGVQLDRVSASALTYMLPGAPGSIAAAAHEGTEPLRVTHRMLDRGFGLDVRSAERVWLCENPAILSMAADRLGDRCEPLVCLEGMPSSVTGRLLAQLTAGGATLHVHTDFDFGGIAIASHVTGHYGATPWRMGTDDYLAALDGPTSDLAQRVGATSWDPQLGPRMNEHRRAVHEEAIFITLLDDLADSG